MIEFIFKKRDFVYNKNEKEQIMIWDIIRKKYVVLTPEENVRQHIIHSLIKEYKIPKGWISVEKTVKYNQQNRRYDIVVYKDAQTPFLVIECKAPEIAITNDVLLQVSMYHSQLPSQYIMISNGMNTYLGNVSHNGVQWMTEWNLSSIII